jgi:tRNA G46 methylase TrmB
LIQEKFVPVMHRVLAPGGRVQIVTDHKGYWEENVEPVIRAASGFEVVDYNRPGSAGAGEFVGTNFERKYAREGRPFYAIAAVKR